MKFKEKSNGLERNSMDSNDIYFDYSIEISMDSNIIPTNPIEFVGIQLNSREFN